MLFVTVSPCFQAVWPYYDAILTYLWLVLICPLKHNRFFLKHYIKTNTFQISFSLQTSSLWRNMKLAANPSCVKPSTCFSWAYSTWRKSQNQVKYMGKISRISWTAAHIWQAIHAEITKTTHVKGVTLYVAVHLGDNIDFWRCGKTRGDWKKKLMEMPGIC